MKYIEEISIGDCFILENNKYILTTDFKKSGQRMCVNLTDGSIKWIEGNIVIDQIDIFMVDKETNIIAIKERKKTNDMDIKA
jgi:hypothetical protein